MASDKWLDNYSGQTTDELLTLEGECRIDSLVVAFQQALIQKEDKTGYQGLALEERTVLVVEMIEQEVNNGGYLQLFGNFPEYAAELVATLERIGCAQAAELTQEALDLLNIDGPVSTNAVKTATDELDEDVTDALSDCDSRYFKNIGDLAPAVLAYIKANRHKITIPA